jgi:uncharacterized membrane protein
MGRHKLRNDQRAGRREQFAPAATQSGGRPWTAAIIAAGVVLVGLIYVVATREVGAGTVASAVAAVGSDVRLDVAQFDDGQAHFYRHTNAAGKEIRFFVLRSSDGVIRAAFDTCDVCYRARRGYRQVGDTMVCNNCDQVFRSVDINVLQGGCNPVPLDRIVQNGQVVLTAAALDAGVFYF